MNLGYAHNQIKRLSFLTAPRNAGAVYSADSLFLNISGTTSFIGNLAQSGGGAMSISSPEQLWVRGTSFVSNTASFGGAIALNSGVDASRTFEECTFEENMASDGGALYLYTSAGQDVVLGSVFLRNYAGEWAPKRKLCGVHYFPHGTWPRDFVW